ncbi:2-dehydropantoate 2-reductase [Inhella proteolytica]|uniref:2-dehydropantoate 2-reductase n=1 Tax=Inhella proteolytica TaxID=2795029 RepID=A0A931NI44_9BURK|nr:2-dehydropantoate 2-reductase [Inhella proteolytica]MBH9578463.1 2-dehydropantoate 2-reductase [Inhella proteolytica]
MRVAVVGCGAIGGWLAGRLADAGVAVSVLARGATLRALQQRGLRIQEAGVERNLKLPASDRPEELGLHDVVILAVKGQAAAQAVPLAAALRAPEGKVWTAMNGVPWWFADGLPALQNKPLRSLDPEGRLLAQLGAAEVLGGVVHASCQNPEPALVRHVMGQGLLVGDPHAAGSAAEAGLVSLLLQAGFEAKASANIRQDLWYKLWGNATTNPISALTGATTDRILDDPQVLALTDAAMHELAAVGAAIGCPVPHTPEERHAITRRLGAFKTSMLQDREAGRRLEIDALLAAPREIAERVGVATPMLDALHGLARLLDGSLAAA